MVQINFANKEIQCKIVYYGPGMSGKTTNLEVVHKKAPGGAKGDLTSIATEGDRTLFFDFMPLDLGNIAGIKTKFQLYTVPGQVYYNSTRKLVLLGADGVIFVADSSADKMAENKQSLENLRENLAEMGKDFTRFPIVYQWNKRDMDNVESVEVLQAEINPLNAPAFEAVANKGEGVFQTLKALSKLVLANINSTDKVGGGTVTRTQSSAAKKAKSAEVTPAVETAAPAQPAAPVNEVAPAAAVAPEVASALQIERNDMSAAPVAEPNAMRPAASAQPAAAAPPAAGGQEIGRVPPAKPAVASSPLDELSRSGSMARPQAQQAHATAVAPPPPQAGGTAPAGTDPMVNLMSRSDGATSGAHAPTQNEDVFRREARVIGGRPNSSNGRRGRNSGGQSTAVVAIVTGLVVAGVAVAAWFLFLS